MLSNTHKIYKTQDLMNGFKEVVTNAQHELNNGKLNLDDHNLILSAEVGQIEEEGLKKVYRQVENLQKKARAINTRNNGFISREELVP